MTVSISDPWIHEASRLWKEGYTSFQIADKIKRDRNAILKATLKRRDLFPHRSKEWRAQVQSEYKRKSKYE